MYIMHASQPQRGKTHNPSSINSLKAASHSFNISDQIRTEKSTHLFASTELVEERSSASDLASSEAVKARIVAVVHPVVDGVDAAAGARVLADGAAGRSSLLRRGVGDGVAGGRAAALEDVVETEPVADFVGGGGTLVEVCGGAAGHGVGEVDAAVEGEVGGGGVGDGEVAPVLIVRGSLLIERNRYGFFGVIAYHPRVPPGMSEAK